MRDIRRLFWRRPRITLEHLHEHLLTVLERQHQQIKFLEMIIMNNTELSAKLDELGTGLGEVSTQLTKSQGEIEAEIAALKALIEAGGGTTPEIDAKLVSLSEKVAALKNSAQALDDLNPDTAEG